MVSRAYSEGASNDIAVTNNPILQPNTSPNMHIKGVQMLLFLQISFKIYLGDYVDGRHK